MKTKSAITVSFPLGLFGTATMNVPPSSPVEDLSPAFPLDRELLDMPNIIPDMEGAEDYPQLGDS